MKNIFKNGISSNMLKTIAIIAMVIDHIAFYFSPFIPIIVYRICRYIGRIAMPIFTYLIVQGFFHTKSFRKYVLRLSIFSVITQILITVLMIINIKYVPGYTAAKQVYVNGNILITFVLSLGELKIIHEKQIIKKWDLNKNIFVRLLLGIMLGLLIILLPLDYSQEVLVLSVLLYYIEKLRIQVLMSKQNSSLNIKNIAAKGISYEKINVIYISLIFLALLSLVIYFNARFTLLFAVLPIAIYSHERGKCNNFVKYMYYILFPLNHVLLYSLALIIMLT